MGTAVVVCCVAVTAVGRAAGTAAESLEVEAIG